MEYTEQPQVNQQQVPVSQDEIYATQLQEDKIRNIISQIAPENQLIELQWRLKGYIKDLTSQEWMKIEKTTSEPSAEMVSKYVSFASSILNQNTTMTCLQPEEINRRMLLYIKWFVDDMDTHATEYNIGNDYTERTRIGMILFNFIFDVLKRAQGGIERNKMWGSMSLSEQQNPAILMQKKKTFMDSIREWKI